MVSRERRHGGLACECGFFFTCKGTNFVFRPILVGLVSTFHTHRNGSVLLFTTTSPFFSKMKFQRCQVVNRNSSHKANWEVASPCDGRITCKAEAAPLQLHPALKIRYPVPHRESRLSGVWNPNPSSQVPAHGQSMIHSSCAPTRLRTRNPFLIPFNNEDPSTRPLTVANHRQSISENDP